MSLPGSVDKKPAWSTSTIVGLSIPVVFLPLYFKFSEFFAASLSDLAGQVLYTLVMILFSAGLIAVVVWWEKGPLTDLGIKSITRRGIIWTLSASLVVMIASAVITGTIMDIFSISIEELSGDFFQNLPVWWLITISTISEEILYRGFLIERLEKLTGNVWWGAGISVVWFTLLHLSRGAAYAFAFIFPPTLLIVLWYVWRRDLVSCIIIHLIFNAPQIIGAALLPYLQS